MKSTDHANNLKYDESAECEISLIDIANFLEESWKKLAIASLVGAAMGLGGWLALSKYSAEYVLLNNNNNNSYALDLVSWKMLQKSLPNLANQAVDENKISNNQLWLYKQMSSDQWWKKNVLLSFALSKADTKDLAGVSKELDLASTTILSFTLTASGDSKEGAIDNVRSAANFLLTGSAYLQLRSLLSFYEMQNLSMVAELQQKITSTQIEMAYQLERAKSLEELYKRFPGGGSSAQQVVDPKDSGAKYLPLTTQIIAVNNDINTSKESLIRLQKRIDQITLAKTFLEQALPLQDQTFDGLALNKQLLEVESNLRTKLSKDDSNGTQFLNELRYQLLLIQARFTKGIEANTPPTSNDKKGVIESTAGGLASAFFLMFMVLLSQRAWIGIKGRGVK